MDTPFFELLAHVEMKQEQEKGKRFSDFMNMFYANPMTDKKARKDYIKQISPKEATFKVANKKGALVTDLSQLRLLKQMQAQEANAEKLKGG